MMKSRPPYGSSEDGPRMEFDGSMTYGDYLSLDKVFDAQAPRSKAHDEMLFIIQHQTSELWMKLVVHELVAAKAEIAEGDLSLALKMLGRVARIFEQLISAWLVLRTMTPSEFNEFRGDLAQSTGFQSYQYRAIEYLAGNKNAAMLHPHAHLPEIHGWLKGLCDGSSIYDEAIRRLAREGFAIDRAVLNRDRSITHTDNPSVQRAWVEVYEDPSKYWPLYELAEKLVDFEDNFRRWRFNHLTTVERVIGFKRGTGGSSGVAYLRSMLEVVLFPELWSIRADL